jgi:DNA-binding transcriptional regulator of glucitol operon
MIKVTTPMASRWVKAAFLVVLAIVLLLYVNRFVDDLKTTAANLDFTVAFEGIWDLLTILLWVLIAWLFVDAVLTVVLSLHEQRYTLSDVMKRLEAIEKRLGISQTTASRGTMELSGEVEEITDEDSAVTEDEEVPPPPKE